jgi:hypothetical protein
MKRFINTPFFCLIKTDRNPSLSSLEEKYDAFAFFVSGESSGMEGPDCLKALIYTQTELESLLEESEKKAYGQF